MTAVAGLTLKSFIGKGERAKSFSRRTCALGVWLGLMFIGIDVALLGVQSVQAVTNSIAVDFNAPGELTGLFNDGYGTPSWSQNTSGGIAGGGGITIPDGSSDLYICQQGFPMLVGATYTVGAYFYNYNNSGYGGLGFTTLTSGTINGGYCTPLSAIGVSFHGGGGFMDNNSASTPATTSVNWDTSVAGANWFYFKVTLTCTSANTYNQTMEIWQCDTNGNVGTKLTATTVTGQVNATLGAAATIYPFFGAAQSRFIAADSFTATTTATATPTVTIWPTATAITYGQTLASSTLSGGSASVAGIFAFTTPATAPVVGATSQGVTFTPTDTTNYNTVSGTVNVTVLPTPSTLYNVQFSPGNQQTGAAVVGASGDAWNQMTSASGSSSLLTSGGGSNGVSITWSAGGIYSFSSVFGGGDAAMMGGYLYASSANSISFSGLPANRHCTLYIYTQGDSGGGGRQLQVTVNGNTYTATPGVASAITFVAGQNYLAITGVTDGSGNLSFTYTYASLNEADINGIQLQLLPNSMDTWVGNTSTNFSGLNWTGTNNPPVSGDALVFGPAGTAGTKLAANQTAGISYAGITFTTNASAYTINGANGITLTGGITNNSPSLQTLNMPIACPAVQTFGGGNLTLGGVISGAGGISKAGSGALNLTGNNTYIGSITMDEGFLFLSGNNTTNTGPTTVNGGNMDLSGDNNYVGPTTVNGGYSVFSGNNNYGDSITVNGGYLYLSGNNTTNTGPTTVNGGNLGFSGNNNYGDSITVNGGTLGLSGNNTTNTGPTTVNGGYMDLSGDNNYVGPTTINAGGTLDLDCLIGADSVITIASGAELTTCSPDYGYYTNNSTAAGTVAVYGRLFPGVSPGIPNTLNTGSETWYGGTNNSDGYVVSLNGNLAGTPNVDWPCLNITGTLNIAATSGHPFALWPSCSWVFNNVQDYTWRIATASGGVVGFDASKFTIRMDNIAGAWPGGLGGGQFIVTQSGNDVNLQFFHVVAHPVTAYRAFGAALSLPVATLLASVSGGTSAYTLTRVTSRNTNDYVQISGPNILFAPANPNAPSSTLDYFVQSVVGVPAYTNSGVLTVIETNVAGISQSITGSGGTRTISLAGVPGSQFMVQRSTNLTDWVNLDGSSGTTNSIITATTNGLWNFTDPNPPAGSAFYRTVQAYVSVIWGGLNPTYDGTPKSVTATFSPPGTTVNITYNGSSTPPTGAGSYTVVGTVSNGSYSGSATNTLTIAKATATITVADDGLNDGQATATTSPPGLTVILNYVDVSGYVYAVNVNGVTATINDPNYTGVAYGTAMWSNVQNQ